MSTPFVGRGEELEALSALVSTARSDGVPTVGLIVGEPGSGKSRLLREALAGIDPPRRVLVAGFEPSQPIPLGAMGELIRRLGRVPGFGARLEALTFGSTDTQGQGALAVFEAAHRAHAALGLLVLAVDDLQWIDEQSLALLHYLINAADATRRPLAVVAASRPSPAASEFASAVAGRLADDHRATIALRGLPLRDGVELAQAIDGSLDDRAAELLWRQAVGSPFWLEALARDRGAADPSELVSDRLRGLSGDAGTLLNSLAIGARPFSRDELEGLVEWPMERLDHAIRELAGRALAIDEAGVIRLAHDLIREAASRAIPVSTRLALRARLADQLERSAGDDLSLLTEALDHRMAAGLASAGLAARALASPQRRLLGPEALRRLSAVADALPLGSTQQADLDAELGRLAGDVGEHALAVHHWSRLAMTAPKRRARQRAELEAARAGYDTSPPAEVRRHLGQARSGAVDTVMGIELDTIEARVALEVDHDVIAAQSVAARAVASVRELVAAAGGAERLAPEARLIALDALAVAGDVALDMDLGDQAREFCDAVLVMADGLGPEARVSALLHAGFAFAMLGQFSDAEAHYREAWQLTEAQLRPRAQVEAGIFLARVLYGRGRLEESRSIAAQSQELQARVRPWLWGEMSNAIQHVAELAIGVPGSLANIGVDAVGLDPHYSMIMHLQVAGWLAREDVVANAADTERELAAARSGAAIAGCLRCASELQAVSAEVLARSGRVAEADAALKRWEASLSGGGYPLRELWAARTRALIEVAAHGSGAPSMLESLAQRCESEDLLLDAMWARLDLGRVATASGDRPAAIAAFTAAVELAERSGAAGVARRANRELRALGVRAWRRSPGRPAPGRLAELSDREREVAHLAAGGSSNREIAVALAVSPKTVERHLTNILAKLGARNRTELAGFVHAGSGTGFPR